MGLLATLAELLSHLRVLQPLLERSVGGARASDQAQRVQADLLGAQSSLQKSLDAAAGQQQARLDQLDESVKRISNLLAEITIEHGKLKEDFRRMNRTLRAVLVLSVTVLAAVVAGIALVFMHPR